MEKKNLYQQPNQQKQSEADCYSSPLLQTVEEQEKTCYSRLQTDPPSSVPMSLSAPTLRPGPYTLQPPAGASGRLAAMTRPGGATYGGPSFSSQLHHGYSFNPQSSQTAGFSFQNSMLFPGSQGSSVLPPPPPPPPLPSAASLPPSTSSMPLPDSPSQDSADSMLRQSSVPRRQSVSSHGSPIPPSSPIMEDGGSADHYKLCGSYRVCPPSLNTMGMSSPFNSFPAPHQPTSLSAMAGVGYPPPLNPQSAAGMGHASALYTAQDSMCAGGTAPLGLPMWNYSTLPGMSLSNNSMTKLSLDTPRYKLTPERAVPLIKWFEDHKEHPYPTRHEKMLLCQSTQLTYTQVSTWFANARRRMKKANSEEDENRSNQSSSDECGSQNSLDSPHRSS